MQRKIWKVELSKDALKYLKKLESKRAQRILDRLEELKELENPILHKDVRPLTGKLRGFYRLKISELRIIFELDLRDRRIGIHIIVPRGNAY